jgi:hypothetical protein
LVEFGPPTPQERLALLTLYFQKSGIDAQKFDIEELAYTMTGQYSHDWVKAMAEQALVYDTQETLLKYILDTNEKVRMISRLPDMARPGMEKAPRHKWGRKADLEAVAEAKTRVAKTKEWLAKQAQGTEPEEAPPFLDGDDSDEEEYDAESADGPNPNVWKFK